MSDKNGDRISIVLASQRSIGNKIRGKGFVLMEGYMESGVSFAHLSKAIQLKQAAVVVSKGKAIDGDANNTTDPVDPPAEIPTRLRVHAAAKAAGVKSKDLITAAHSKGIELKSAASMITLEEFHRIYPEGK